MQDAKRERQGKENQEKDDINKEAIQRVAAFMQKDDETFFKHIIQGLTGSEIEEFLEECPEFRPFWKTGKTNEFPK